MGKVAGTTTGFVAPLGEFTQFVGDKLIVSCNTKPAVFGVHEIVALPGVAGPMVSVGAPGVCITVGNAQNPPVTAY